MDAPIQRTPIRFVLVFALAALVQFALLLAPLFRPFFDAFTTHLATLSAVLIHALGGSCLQHGVTLSSPVNGFSMEVRDGCNGVNAVILLWAAIMAYPSQLKWRLAGLAGGFVAIQSVNILRLVSLFYLGQSSPSLFEFAHLYLWETLIIIDAIVVFGLWARHAAVR